MVKLHFMFGVILTGTNIEYGLKSSQNFEWPTDTVKEVEVGFTQTKI
jgi:hypothetical protein